MNKENIRKKIKQYYDDMSREQLISQLKRSGLSVNEDEKQMSSIRTSGQSGKSCFNIKTKSRMFITRLSEKNQTLF
ncbi:hypothetical protein P5495_001690 [Bacillus velezensis]|nr:hypothetical protein [Bacillus velezensis]MDH3104342.1 hypothetical protein [Bacillus velezensis]MDH3138389.1 hypothetical protein [Bacillus velezensis]